MRTEQIQPDPDETADDVTSEGDVTRLASVAELADLARLRAKEPRRRNFAFGFVIFLLLYGQFKNVTLSAMVLCNLPLALIGGVFAVAVSSATVSIPSIIGFITLFGVAVRNGVLLVSRYEHLYQESNSLHDIIVKGSLDRLNPILMTALTSALALIPLIFNGDKSGNEIQSPMAIVVLGGLITSTLLNIYIMPIMYEMYKRRKSEKESNAELSSQPLEEPSL